MERTLSNQHQNLNRWIKKLEDSIEYCYDQYVRSLEDKSCSDEISSAYCRMTVNNRRLRDVLSHIRHYGDIVSDDCTACELNHMYSHDKHCQDLKDTHSQYRKLINRILNVKD